MGNSPHCKSQWVTALNSKQMLKLPETHRWGFSRVWAHVLGPSLSSRRQCAKMQELWGTFMGRGAEGTVAVAQAAGLTQKWQWQFSPAELFSDTVLGTLFWLQSPKLVFKPPIDSVTYPIFHFIKFLFCLNQSER